MLAGFLCHDFPEGFDEIPLVFRRRETGRQAGASMRNKEYIARAPYFREYPSPRRRCFHDHFLQVLQGHGASVYMNALRSAYFPSSA